MTDQIQMRSMLGSSFEYLIREGTREQFDQAAMARQTYALERIAAASLRIAAALEKMAGIDAEAQGRPSEKC